MRSRLLLLNLALLALAGLGIWRLRLNWEAARQRETSLLRLRLPALPPAQVMIPPPPGQVSAASYVDVAARLLFSRDRNPTVVIEAPPAKPRPPLPKFHGAMDFGSGLSLVMSSGTEGSQKSYKIGDKVGDYVILEATPAGFVFEWEGQKVKASVEELMVRAAREAPGAASTPRAESATTPLSAPVVTTPAASVPARPGADMGAGFRACAAGDTSPSGTLADGFKKVVATTPFGQACRWEPAK